MQRSLKTPIRKTVPAYVPRMPRPYLRLDSELDETGRSVEHSIRAILSRGAYAEDSPYGPVMRHVERMVEVPWCMPWRPQIVRLAMLPGIDYGEPDREVLRAFSYIRGVPHDIDLRNISHNEIGDVYIAQVDRSSIVLEIDEDHTETTRFRVTKAALAAAGLRLAAATTIIDATPPGDQAWQSGV